MQNAGVESVSRRVFAENSFFLLKLGLFCPKVEKCSKTHEISSDLRFVPWIRTQFLRSFQKRQRKVDLRRLRKGAKNKYFSKKKRFFFKQTGHLTSFSDEKATAPSAPREAASPPRRN